MKLLIVLAAVLACTLAVEEEVAPVTHYYGYQVIRVFAKSEEQMEVLHQLEEQGHLDFWSDIRKDGPTDIMVGPNQMKAFRAHLLRHRIAFDTWIADVEQNIENERQEQAKALAKQSGMNWDAYHPITTIHAWLNELAQAYPNLVTVRNLGKSYLNHDLPLAIVSTGGSGKKAIWLDGNIHAREWISPATVTYILNELVTKSGDHADLLEKFDFYILPNVNPDGYAWTHSNARLWRKTRTNHASPLGCLGVDGNRNWGYLWGQPGASNDKCSDTYRGPSVFSEQENDIIAKYILATSVDWTLFITFHSYGQYVLLPYGDGNRPTDYNDLLAKGNTFADALRAVSGTTYRVGNSKDLLYATSGTSQDWAKGSGPFKYSYTVELRDTGSYGFQLPANQIKPTGAETWVGLKELLRSL
jgi:murein tripeptide amidase MpaA